MRYTFLATKNIIATKQLYPFILSRFSSNKFKYLKLPWFYMATAVMEPYICHI